MKLYDAATAPNPRRVRVFIAEKGLDVPCEQVDIMKAVNRGEEFRRNVNPMGTLPVLELDDGTCIAETGAVCRYFEEVQPDPPLLGVDAKDKAVVEMWNRRMELELFQPATLAFQQQHEFFKGRVPQVPEYAAVSKAKAEKTLAWLDGVLADREYIAGARFYRGRHRGPCARWISAGCRRSNCNPTRRTWLAGTSRSPPVRAPRRDKYARLNGDAPLAGRRGRPLL